MWDYVLNEKYEYESICTHYAFIYNHLHNRLDMEDFSKLSSKTVTEVLMLELKMSPAAKTFLISGFPRSMRDVVEYTDKVIWKPIEYCNNNIIIFKFAIIFVKCFKINFYKYLINV